MSISSITPTNPSATPLTLNPSSIKGAGGKHHHHHVESAPQESSDSTTTSSSSAASSPSSDTNSGTDQKTASLFNLLG